MTDDQVSKICRELRLLSFGGASCPIDKELNDCWDSSLKGTGENTVLILGKIRDELHGIRQAIESLVELKS